MPAQRRPNQTTLTLPPRLRERLRAHAEATEQPVSEIIRAACVDYLSKYEKETTMSNTTETTHVRIRERGGEQRTIASGDTREGESWQQCANRLWNAAHKLRGRGETICCQERHAEGLYLVQFGRSLRGANPGENISLGPQMIVYVD